MAGEHGFTGGKDVYNLDSILSRLRTLENRIKETYPVGSIYMTVDKNANPSSLFGGTWVRWGEGRVAVGYGGSYSQPEGTGGMVQEQLNASQIPQHRHSSALTINPTSQYEGLVAGAVGVGFNGGDHTALVVDYTKKAGNAFSISGGDYNPPNPVSKMQPYIICCMWKRTA